MAPVGLTQSGPIRPMWQLSLGSAKANVECTQNGERERERERKQHTDTDEFCLSDCPCQRNHQALCLTMSQANCDTFSAAVFLSCAVQLETRRFVRCLNSLQQPSWENFVFCTRPMVGLILIVPIEICFHNETQKTR